MRGTVKNWLPDKGYGFIKGDDGADYFVHWSEILMESRRKKLKEGQRVTFDAEKSEKGWAAVAVRPDNDGMEEKS